MGLEPYDSKLHPAPLEKAQDLYQFCHGRHALGVVCLHSGAASLHDGAGYPAPLLQRNTVRGYPLSSDNSLAGPITELGFSQLTTSGPITGQYS